MRFLLVGSHFNPPAKLLIAGYLAGLTEVQLTPEPDNPYDPGAVKVTVQKASLACHDDPEELDGQLAGYGLSLESLPDDIMLGHLAASGGKPLEKAQQVSPSLRGNLDAAGYETGRLLFGGNGQVLVEVAEQPEMPDRSDPSAQ